MANKQIPVSVVIPVYNSEAYLPRALDSMRDQTLNELEVVLVNDGSEGDCDRIYREYKSSLNIRYVKLEKNSGRLIARIEGMKAAQGEYVGFVDADDFAELNMFETMYKAGKKNRAEIVHCLAYITTDHGKKNWDLGKPRNEILRGKQIFQNFLDHNLIWSLWDKIYKTSVIQKSIPEIPYIRQQLNEDTIISCPIFYHAKKYIAVNSRLYNYYENPQGAMRTFNHERIGDLLRVILYVKDFCESRGIDFSSYKLYNSMCVWPFPLFHKLPEESVGEISNIIEEYFPKVGYRGIARGLSDYLDLLKKKPSKKAGKDTPKVSVHEPFPRIEELDNQKRNIQLNRPRLEEFHGNDKIILHIGLAKTGTTALQEFLFKNSEELFRRGFYYPTDKLFLSKRWKYLHLPLSNCLSRDLPNPDAIHYNPEFLYYELKKSILKHSDITTIISCEQLSGLPIGSIQRIKKLLEEYDVKVVVYLRRQDKLLTSLYRQAVKTNLVSADKSYQLDEYEFYQQSNIDYFNFLNRWGNVFGKEKLLIRLYQSGINVIEDFAAINDVDISGLDRDLQRNISIGRETAELVRASRRINFEFDSGKGQNFSWQIRKLSEAYGHESRLSTIPPDERKRILQSKYGESNRKVAKEFLSKENGILFQTVDLDKEEWYPFEGIEAGRAAYILYGISRKEIGKKTSSEREQRKENSFNKTEGRNKSHQNKSKSLDSTEVSNLVKPIIKAWEKYFQNTPIEKIRSSIEDLVKNTDVLSKATVYRHIERMSLLPQIAVQKKAVIIKKDLLDECVKWDSLFYEKLSSGFAQYLRRLRRRYELPPEIKFPPDIIFGGGPGVLPDNILSRIRNGGTVIDCGAFRGETAIIYHDFLHPKMIVAIEPVPQNFNILMNLIKDNNLGRDIIPIQAGVYKSNTELSFSNKEDSSSASRILLEDVDETIGIEVRTIDSIVEENSINDVRLIKLDIENLEVEGLEGARKTIARDKPVLLTAIYHSPQEFYSVKRTIDSWNLGYKHMIRDMAPANQITEVVLISYPWK